MTRAEREQLITRFLDGSLPHGDEERFFLELAADREMQHDLKAERTLDSAVAKDRDLAVESWGPFRAELAVLLAARTAETDQMSGSSGISIFVPLGILASGLLILLLSLPRSSSNSPPLSTPQIPVEAVEAPATPATHLPSIVPDSEKHEPVADQDRAAQSPRVPRRARESRVESAAPEEPASIDHSVQERNANPVEPDNPKLTLDPDSENPD